MPLTLEERERRAYIEGRTEEAALLADAIEAQNAADDELRHEVEMLKRDNRDLESENDRLQEDIEAAETKLEKLRDSMNEVLATHA